jgi:hypothetical protein
MRRSQGSSIEAVGAFVLDIVALESRSRRDAL